MDSDPAGDSALKEAAAIAMDGAFAKMAGIITSVKLKSTRNNSMMAFVELEDMYGSIEMIVFPKVLSTYNSILREDEVVLVEGRISQKEDEGAKLLLDRIKPMKKGEVTEFLPKYKSGYNKGGYGGDSNGGAGASQGKSGNGGQYGSQNKGQSGGSNGSQNKGQSGGSNGSQNGSAGGSPKTAAAEKLYVRVNTAREPVAVNILTDCISAYPGNMQVIIVDAGKMENGKPTVLAADSSKWVEKNEKLLGELREKFGDENVVIR